MNRQGRRQLNAVTTDVGAWVELAKSHLERRRWIEDAAASATMALRRAVLDVRRGDVPAWRVLPLRAGDETRLGAVERRTRLPELTPADTEYLRFLEGDDVARSLRDARHLLGVRRFFTGKARRDAGEQAAELLTRYRDWGIEHDLPAALARLAPGPDGATKVSLADALSADVGLVRALALPGEPELIPAAAIAGLGRAVAAIRRELAAEERYRSAAIEAGEQVRRAETQRMLAEMPVDRLREATRGRLAEVLRKLEAAGITTVAQVLDQGTRLQQQAGIGPGPATRILGAAQTLWQTTFDEMPVRIDIASRTPQTTELLRRLGEWDARRRLRNAAADVERAEYLAGLGAVDGQAEQLVVFAAGELDAQALLAEVESVRQRAALLEGAPASRVVSADPWEDFFARPADYFAMLVELGLAKEHEERTHGDLPEQIVEAVRAFSLNTHYLMVGSLRGYQSFAARFALVQRRVIIGDEMGLGKTVEALAVLAHLRSQGHHHWIVICPAAVVTNWIREISSKTALRPFRIHGPDRESAAKEWVRSGGVAVTTFDTLYWFRGRIPDHLDIGCVVVDEAHYIKNPATQRSQNTAAVLRRSDRAVLLTGTPMENRLEEFANLVRHVQPQLVVDTSGRSPKRFRSQVAPAYLRRNQEDVLTELPGQVDIDEWVSMSDADFAAYRRAVEAGNFMAMRMAAMTQGRKSHKVQRLREIVAEAEDNGRRVLVFSYFKDVVRQVVQELPGQVIGPIQGSVPAGERQRIIDQFSAAKGGAVLVAQILSGGVGLNIQAASVVVICEPQVKPTIEWQAIARARRMGQVETVQVHRLLSEEGVDRRITEILGPKIALFQKYARVSATAESAPEAFDVTEAELARQVIADERQRLFGAASSASPTEVIAS